jgi:hypothetical protein
MALVADMIAKISSAATGGTDELPISAPAHYAAVNALRAGVNDVLPVWTALTDARIGARADVRGSFASRRETNILATSSFSARVVASCARVEAKR